jgi:hypothetical protein
VTVRELIERLQACDLEQRARLWVDGSWSPIETIVRGRHGVAYLVAPGEDFPEAMKNQQERHALRMKK